MRMHNKSAKQCEVEAQEEAANILAHLAANTRRVSVIFATTINRSMILLTLTALLREGDNRPKKAYKYLAQEV